MRLAWHYVKQHSAAAARCSDGLLPSARARCTAAEGRCTRTRRTTISVMGSLSQSGLRPNGSNECTHGALVRAVSPGMAAAKGAADPERSGREGLAGRRRRVSLSVERGTYPYSRAPKIQVARAAPVPCQMATNRCFERPGPAGTVPGLLSFTPSSHAKRHTKVHSLSPTPRHCDLPDRAGTSRTGDAGGVPARRDQGRAPH